MRQPYLPGVYSGNVLPATYFAPQAVTGFNTQDSGSLKYVPASAAEYTGAGFGSPEAIWLMQEASGNLADQVAGKALVTSGSPLYQQAIAGWTRKAVGASGLAANQLFSNASMSNVASVSVAFLVYALINQPVGAPQRVFYGAASGNAFEGVAGSKVLRLRNGANAGNGVLDHTVGVHPFVVVHDITNSQNNIYSDIEKKNIVFGAAAGTTIQFQTGISTDTTSNSQYLYGASWAGAAAEMNDAAVKALLTALGWPVSGY